MNTNSRKIDASELRLRESFENRTIPTPPVSFASPSLYYCSSVFVCEEEEATCLAATLPMRSLSGSIVHHPFQFAPPPAR